MSGLSKLIALQKQKNNQGIKANDENGTRESNVHESASAPGKTAGPVDSDSVASVPSSDSSTQSTQTEVAAKPKGLGLGLGNLPKRNATVGGAPSGGAGVTRASNAGGANESIGNGSAGFSLDDIAKLDESATPELRERSDDSSGFADEILATAPDRDLPEGLEAQQLNFVEQLDGIYQILNDAEMFAQSVRVVMMELQENPEYIKLISDQDVHTMIAGMRRSMGLARIKKQEKSRKTGTATKKAAGKKAAEMDNALQLLDSLGFGDD